MEFLQFGCFFWCQTGNMFGFWLFMGELYENTVYNYVYVFVCI